MSKERKQRVISLRLILLVGPKLSILDKKEKKYTFINKYKYSKNVQIKNMQILIQSCNF